MSRGFGNLEADEIIEKNDNALSLIFTISEESQYFDGHFPGYPILPAVAQIDIVINFASRYFGTGFIISQIKRTKFTKIITPSLILLLKIKKNKNMLNFEITTADGSETYSSGTIVQPSEAEDI